MFGTLQAALANATAFVTQIDKFGSKVTVAELIGAGTRLEKMGMIAALSASYYVGAVIGSIAVATGRTISGGTSLSDVLLLARQNNLDRSWLKSDLRRWPGIYDRSVLGRSICRPMVKQR
ncbi:MAG TPA: hypothetical protein VGF27_23715 [Pseudoduganella sp.]